MCMEDVRIARASKSDVMVKTSQAADGVILLGPNKNRLAITFYCQTADQVAIALEGMIDGAANGIMLTAHNMPLTLRLEDYGEVLTKNIRYSDSTGGANLTVIQITMDKEKP